MSDDKFQLSIGQAQQLEFAFQRNGWTGALVHALCREDTLARVASLLNDSEAMTGAGLATAFKGAGFTDQEVAFLTGPYEYKWGFLYFNGCETWEAKRANLLEVMAGIVRGEVIPVPKSRLEEMQKVHAEEAEVRAEKRILLSLVNARIDGPVESLFTEEACKEACSRPKEDGNPLYLRANVLRFFRRENIKTLRDLLTYTQRKLWQAPGMGRKSIYLIRSVLAERGLYFDFKFPEGCE